MKTTGRKCNQCGGDLILVKTIIEEGDAPSPVTSHIYQCTNKACQDDINKKTADRVKHFKEQEKARTLRYKNRAKN